MDSAVPTLPFETPTFRTAFLELLAWRRDVRRFRPDPLPPSLVATLLEAAELAPSVGLSQAWRFVRVRSPQRRARIQENFTRCNADALAEYEGPQAALYARLKLSGLQDAPEQIAVFSDQDTTVGGRLGRRTMPQSLDYSVVAAIQNLWLLARCHGVGVGWLSILDPEAVAQALETPPSWKLIAYLCLGYPEAAADTPELQRAGWEARRKADGFVLER